MEKTPTAKGMAKIMIVMVKIAAITTARATARATVRTTIIMAKIEATTMAKIMIITAKIVAIITARTMGSQIMAKTTTTTAKIEAITTVKIVATTMASHILQSRQQSLLLTMDIPPQLQPVGSSILIPKTPSVHAATTRPATATS